MCPCVWCRRVRYDDSLSADGRPMICLCLSCRLLYTVCVCVWCIIRYIVETSPRNACNRPFDLIFLSAFCVFPFARVVVLPIPPPSHPLSLGNERREEYRPHSDEIIVFCYLINNSEHKRENGQCWGPLVAHCASHILPIFQSNKRGVVSGTAILSSTVITEPYGKLFRCWEWVDYNFMGNAYIRFFLTAFSWCVIFKKLYFLFLVQILISILSDRNNTVEIAKIIVKRKTFKWRTTTTTTNQQTKNVKENRREA